MGVHLLDFWRYLILHINNLHSSYAVESGQPEEKLFFCPCEEEKLSIFCLQRERILPLARHNMLLVVVVDYRVNVEELGEGYLEGLFGHFLVLNNKDALLLVQDEVPLVVERKGEEFDFFRHFEEVALDFIFFVLVKGRF